MPVNLIRLAVFFNRFGGIFYIFGGNFIELPVILILIGSKNKNVAGKLTNFSKVFWRYYFVKQILVTFTDLINDKSDISILIKSTQN